MTDFFCPCLSMKDNQKIWPNLWPCPTPENLWKPNVHILTIMRRSNMPFMATELLVIRIKASKINKIFQLGSVGFYICVTWSLHKQNPLPVGSHHSIFHLTISNVNQFLSSFTIIGNSIKCSPLCLSLRAQELSTMFTFYTYSRQRNKLRPSCTFHICVSARVRSGIHNMKVVIHPCLQGSAHTPLRTSTQNLWPLVLLALKARWLRMLFHVCEKSSVLT